MRIRLAFLASLCLAACLSYIHSADAGSNSFRLHSYSPPKAALYPVGARNGIGITTHTGQQSVSRVIVNNAGATCSNVRLRIANWIISPSEIETATGNQIFVHATIEYPIGSTFYNFTIATSRDMVIADGVTIDTDIVSGLSLPNGAQARETFFVTGWVDGAAGGNIPVGRDSTNTNSTFRDYWAEGTTVTDQTNKLGGETTASGAPNNLFTPFSTLCEVVDKSTRSYIFMSDSIGYGSLEGTAADSQGRRGPWERWIGGKGFGAINISRSGIKAADYAPIDAGQFPRLAAAISDVGTHVVVALGRNDMPSNTPTQIQTSLNRIVTYMSSLKKRVFVATILPRTNSSNTITDISDTDRTTVNTAIRAASISGMNGYIEAADQYENTRNGGLWASDTYTTDGLHPTSAANITFAGTTIPIPF